MKRHKKSITRRWREVENCSPPPYTTETIESAQSARVSLHIRVDCLSEANVIEFSHHELPIFMQLDLSLSSERKINFKRNDANDISNPFSLLQRVFFVRLKCKLLTMGKRRRKILCKGSKKKFSPHELLKHEKDSIKTEIRVWKFCELPSGDLTSNPAIIWNRFELFFCELSFFEWAVSRVLEFPRFCCCSKPQPGKIALQGIARVSVPIKAFLLQALRGSYSRPFRFRITVSHQIV